MPRSNPATWPNNQHKLSLTTQSSGQASSWTLLSPAQTTDTFDLYSAQSSACAANNRAHGAALTLDSSAPFEVQRIQAGILPRNAYTPFMIPGVLNPTRLVAGPRASTRAGEPGTVLATATARQGPNLDVERERRLREAAAERILGIAYDAPGLLSLVPECQTPAEEAIALSSPTPEEAREHNLAGRYTKPLRIVPRVTPPQGPTAAAFRRSATVDTLLTRTQTLSLPPEAFSTPASSGAIAPASAVAIPQEPPLCLPPASIWDNTVTSQLPPGRPTRPPRAPARPRPIPSASRVPPTGTATAEAVLRVEAVPAMLETPPRLPAISLWDTAVTSPLPPGRPTRPPRATPKPRNRVRRVVRPRATSPLASHTEEADNYTNTDTDTDNDESYSPVHPDYVIPSFPAPVRRSARLKSPYNAQSQTVLSSDTETEIDADTKLPSFPSPLPSLMGSSRESSIFSSVSSNSSSPASIIIVSGSPPPVNRPLEPKSSSPESVIIVAASGTRVVPAGSGLLSPLISLKNSTSPEPFIVVAAPGAAHSTTLAARSLQDRATVEMGVVLEEVDRQHAADPTAYSSTENFIIVATQEDKAIGDSSNSLTSLSPLQVRRSTGGLLVVATPAIAETGAGIFRDMSEECRGHADLSPLALQSSQLDRVAFELGVTEEVVMEQVTRMQEVQEQSTDGWYQHEGLMSGSGLLNPHEDDNDVEMGVMNSENVGQHMSPPPTLARDRASSEGKNIQNTRTTSKLKATTEPHDIPMSDWIEASPVPVKARVLAKTKISSQLRFRPSPHSSPRAIALGLIVIVRSFQRRQVSLKSITTSSSSSSSTPNTPASAPSSTPYTSPKAAMSGYTTFHPLPRNISGKDHIWLEREMRLLAARMAKEEKVMDALYMLTGNRKVAEGAYEASLVLHEVMLHTVGAWGDCKTVLDAMEEKLRVGKHF